MFKILLGAILMANFANAAEMNIHYNRLGTTDNWNLWVWGEGKDGFEVRPIGNDKFGMLFKVDFKEKGISASKIGILPRRGQWEAKDEPERFFNEEGQNDIYLLEGDGEVYFAPPEVSTKATAAWLDDGNELRLIFSRPVPEDYVSSLKLSVLRVWLGEHKILLCPCPGSFLYISDYQHFRIPEEAIVVGVENMENFRLPERQAAVFEEIGEQFGGGGVPPLLLVSRYPQSKDLVNWLKSIPNYYVHFGDFDLAGIQIFLTEFFAHLGPERSAFFVPDDIENRLLCSGSRERYDVQFARFGKMDVPDLRVLPLVQLIHRCQKGYDQEGYIESRHDA